MTTESGPTLRRRRLARRLRQMREKAGLTIAEAAPMLDKKRSALDRIENAQTIADVHLVRSMTDVYDHYDPDLVEMARAATRPGWWVAYGVRDRGFIGLETDADTALVCELMYIPGLLQTENYMRAVFGTGKVRRSPKRLENQVTARLIRQRRLTNEDHPLSLAAIVDEAALRKPVGGASVMREQLHHLIELAALDTVTFQVVSDEAGSHGGMDGAFTILEFNEEEDPDLLYVEYPTGAVHVEKPDEVREARLVFDRLRSVALPPDDSVAFVERVASQRYPA